jgi:hypothetical protein
MERLVGNEAPVSYGDVPVKKTYTVTDAVDSLGAGRFVS